MITTISEHNLPAARPRLSRATDPKMREFKELLGRAGRDRPTRSADSTRVSWLCGTECRCPRWSSAWSETDPRCFRHVNEANGSALLRVEQVPRGRPQAGGDRRQGGRAAGYSFPINKNRRIADEHDRKGHRSQAGCNATASGQAECRRRATQHSTNPGGQSQWTSETQIGWPSEWCAAFRRPRRSNRRAGRLPRASPSTRDKRRTFASSRRCAFSTGGARERRADPPETNSPDAVVRTAAATDRSTRMRAQEARCCHQESEQEVDRPFGHGLYTASPFNRCGGIVHTATAILFSCCRLECV